MTRSQTLLLSSMLTIVVFACQSGEPEAPAPAPESTAAESTAAEPTATDVSTPESAAAPTASGEVAFEPAYPADVSAEGLSEEDVDQQKAGHSHGDATHTHGEEEDAADHDH